MNMKKYNKKGLLLILTIVLGLGISLASIYFIYSYRDSRENRLATALVLLKFNGDNTINLNSDVPVIDDLGIESTPYKFTITNTSLVPIHANIKLNIGNESTIKFGAVRYALYINDQFIKKDYVHRDDLTLYTYEYMNVGENINCKLKFWIDYYYDEPGQTFNAKVVSEGISFDTLEGEYVKINYIEDLVDLSNEVNNGDTKFEKNYILMQDLDFNNADSYKNASGTTYGDINGNGTTEDIKTELTSTCVNCGGFIPIGSSGSTNVFQGVFNGNNYRIDNIYENNINYGQDKRNLGLFGNIKNAQVGNLTINGNYKVNTKNDCGGFVGRTHGTSVINNYHNEVNIISSLPNYSTGGVAGGNYGNLTINNSSNLGNISGGNNTGGLIGYQEKNLVIQNSYNEGDITKSKGVNVGGLLGRDNATTNSTMIINSYNNGLVSATYDISSSDKLVGGLVGKVAGICNIEDSYNSGKVKFQANSSSKPNNVGGLLGITAGGAIQITNSYNKGIIEINVAEMTTSGIRVGGIIGNKFSNSVNISGSYNSGNITCNPSFDGSNGYCYAGGIVGFSECRGTGGQLLIENSHNIGNILSDWNISHTDIFASGLLGYFNNTNRKVNILNSYNSGDISGATTISGLVRSSWYGTTNIINSYNVGNVTSTGVRASGIISSNATDYINNVYNLGSVNSTTDKAGISVAEQDTITVDNAYYVDTNATGIAVKASFNTFTTPMGLNDMKSQNFVNILNTNVSNINLGSIDSSLASYSLSRWKLGSNGYPVFDWQK